MLHADWPISGLEAQDHQLMSNISKSYVIFAKWSNSLSCSLQMELRCHQWLTLDANPILQSGVRPIQPTQPPQKPGLYTNADGRNYKVKLRKYKHHWTGCRIWCLGSENELKLTKNIKCCYNCIQSKETLFTQLISYWCYIQSHL